MGSWTCYKTKAEDKGHMLQMIMERCKTNLSHIFSIISPSLNFNLVKRLKKRLSPIKEKKRGRTRKANLGIMLHTMGICQELAISYHKSTAIETTIKSWNKGRKVEHLVKTCLPVLVNCRCFCHGRE